jgi:hypothetical protein
MDRRGFSKDKAIRGALHRLGMQARAEVVASYLADRGVTVGAGQVQRVRLELLRDLPGQRWSSGKLSRRGRPPLVRRPPKIPPRRG